MSRVSCFIGDGTNAGSALQARAGKQRCAVCVQVSRELEKECVVVFDEAHNIDNVCIEALSVNLRDNTLTNATANLTSLLTAIQQSKQGDAKRLQDEYNRLVQGLRVGGMLAGWREDMLANPALPPDILNESVPGNIRRHASEGTRARAVDALFASLCIEQKTHGRKTLARQKFPY
jgi:Rad3-related DNA helicase